MRSERSNSSTTPLAMRQCAVKSVPCARSVIQTWWRSTGRARPVPATGTSSPSSSRASHSSEFTGGKRVLRDREAVDVALDLLDALVAFHPDSERLNQLDAKRREGELSEADSTNG